MIDGKESRRDDEKRGEEWSIVGGEILVLTSGSWWDADTKKNNTMTFQNLSLRVTIAKEGEREVVEVAKSFFFFGMSEI